MGLRRAKLDAFGTWIFVCLLLLIWGWFLKAFIILLLSAYTCTCDFVFVWVWFYNRNIKFKLNRHRPGIVGHRMVWHTTLIICLSYLNKKKNHHLMSQVEQPIKIEIVVSLSIDIYNIFIFQMITSSLIVDFRLEVQW